MITIAVDAMGGDHAPDEVVRAVAQTSRESDIQCVLVGDERRIQELLERDGPFNAGEAEELGLVTFAPDEIDWDDEVRVAIEARAAFSPDAMTGLEANLRFAGPETMETKIFGRLTAWQNWIFNRPNAVGEQGALKVYGTGAKAKFNWERV